MPIEIKQEPLPEQDLTKVWISFSQTLWFVIYVDGEWAGYGGLNLVHKSGVAYLGPSFVKPEFRGRGFQRQLLEAREEYAKNNAIWLLTTSTEDDNIYSINNLLACGYTMVPGPRDGYYFEKQIGQVAQLAEAHLSKG
jgi:GNAT superfamily N-acetyltransferase